MPSPETGFRYLGSGDGHRSGDGHQDRDDVTVTWNDWIDPSEISRPPGPDPVVQLRCEAALNADSVSVEMEINTGRTVRFNIRGFVDPNVQQDGKPVVLPIELSAGTHRFTIRAER